MGWKERRIDGNRGRRKKGKGMCEGRKLRGWMYRDGRKEGSRKGKEGGRRKKERKKKGKGRGKEGRKKVGKERKRKEGWKERVKGGREGKERTDGKFDK